MEIWPGTAYPLGATFDGAGTNFAISTEVAQRIGLGVLDDEGLETRIPGRPRRGRATAGRRLDQLAVLQALHAVEHRIAHLPAAPEPAFAPEPTPKRRPSAAPQRSTISATRRAADQESENS